MTLFLSIAFGSFVGFALGMTGGGGGIFAVPLLVYGLGLAPREAVGVSLATVGGIALLGVIPRFLRGEVDTRTGALFAVAGMLGAPIGNRLSGLMSESDLLLLFAGLMLVIATLMWRNAKKPIADTVSPTESRAACQRQEDGRLRLTSRCAKYLTAIGLLTGLFSGMLGVGGGFVIVPALVLLSGMAVHQAVATSLLVIVFVSLSGVGSYLATGGELSAAITGLFLLGGVLGINVGTRTGKRLSGPRLQQVVAVAILVVAIFVVARSLI